MNQDGLYANVRRLDRTKLFVAGGLTILLGIVASQSPERPTEAKIAEETRQAIPAKEDPLAEEPIPPPAMPVAKLESHRPAQTDNERATDMTPATPSPKRESAARIPDDIEVTTTPAEPPITEPGYSTPTLASGEPANTSVPVASVDADATTNSDAASPEHGTPTSSTPIPGSQTGGPTGMSAPTSAATTISEPARAIEPQASAVSSPERLAAPTIDASVEASEEPAEQDAPETKVTAGDDTSKTSGDPTASAPQDVRVDPAAETLAPQPAPAESALAETQVEASTPDLPLETPPLPAEARDAPTPIAPAEPSPHSVAATPPDKPSEMSEAAETTEKSESGPSASPQRPSPAGSEVSSSPPETPTMEGNASRWAPISYVAPTRSGRIRSWALLVLGDHAAWVGRIPAAIAAYERSATVNPRNAVALRRLGDLYFYILRDPNLAGYAYAGAIQRLTAVGHYRAAAHLLWRVSRLHPQLTLELYARLYRK